MEATTAEPTKAPKKKPEVTEEEKSIQNYTKIMESKFPNKFGFVRKINFLWGNKFRVNYYNESDGNKISHSYFCSVLKDDKVKKEWDEQFGNRWSHKEEIV